MEDLNKELEQITEEIENIDKRLDEIARRKAEREEEIPFGLFSIVNNVVKIELLMDADLFKEEELKKLGEMADSMQEILIAIQKREENK